MKKKYKVKAPLGNIVVPKEFMTEERLIVYYPDGVKEFVECKGYMRKLKKVRKTP